MNTRYQEVLSFIHKETRLLDDRQWDEWLACYSEDVEYWMPAWDDNDQLTEDPQSEISLVYYPNRDGLEDRVYRIKTERSGASMPEPRTTHMISNLELLSEEGGVIEIRYNWHTLSYRYQKISQFFGASFVTLRVDGGQLRICKKKVVLNNDYINQVLDVYQLA